MMTRFQSGKEHARSQPAKSATPDARRLQRKCACGGTPGPTGECEECRKKRLRLQRRPSAAGGEFRIDESAAREAEADAIANQIVSGSFMRGILPVQQSSSSGKIQRQRRPEDILPQPHVPKPPTMRPVGAEMVRGFAVTLATCGCASEVAAREQGIDTRISAYAACGARKDVRDPFALEACVRKNVFGASAAKVPALGTADPETSTVRIADAGALALREKLLGEPAEGPCVALRTRAMLVHEGQHLEQFDRIAKELGPAFFEEFKKLEGDPERMEKLRKQFPNETAKYESAWQESVSNNVQAEIESYTAERDFFGEVRTAWSKVCPTTVPAPDVAAPQGEPGRGKVQRRASGGDPVAQAEVPGIVPEVLNSAGQPLDFATRTLMETRFGHDFGRIRIHIDSRSAESAQAVNAEAYTVGQHIAFAANRFAPSTENGRRLLAHELVHTLQQGDGGFTSRISGSTDESERQAETAAERIPGGTFVPGPANRLTPSPGNRSWLARKQTPWPAWHQQVLNDIAKFAGPSDGKSAESKWPQMKAYLCKLSKDKADSLHNRLSPSAPGFTQGTDDFAIYLKNKFPTNHVSIIAILADLKAGKPPALCAPRPRPVTPIPLDQSLPKLRELEPEKPPPRPGTKLDEATGAERCPPQFIESHIVPGDALATKMLHHSLQSLCAALHGNRTTRNKEAYLQLSLIFGTDWRANAQTIYDTLWKLLTAFSGGYLYDCIEGCDPPPNAEYGRSWVKTRLGESDDIKLCYQNLEPMDIPFTAHVMIHEMGHLKLGLEHGEDKESMKCTGDPKDTECYALLAHELWRLVTPEYKSKSGDLCLSGGGREVKKPENWD